MPEGANQTTRDRAGDQHPFLRWVAISTGHIEGSDGNQESPRRAKYDGNSPIVDEEAGDQSDQ
jgi:hypothetical protein